MAKEVKILQIYARGLWHEVKNMSTGFFVNNCIYDCPKIEKEIQNFLSQGYSIINMEMMNDDILNVYLQR